MKITKKAFKNQIFQIEFLSLLAIALFFIVAFVFISYFRLFTLTSNGAFEEDMLMGSDRILNGLPLYSNASPQYIPFLYAPGMFYINSFFEILFGKSMWAARLPSIISVYLLLPFLYILFNFFIKKKIYVFVSSLITWGLYLGIYDKAAYWIDMVKTDSYFILALLLYLISFLILLEKPNIKFYLLNSFTLILVLLTKQSGLLILPASLFYFLLCRPLPKFLSLMTINLTLIGLTVLFFEWRDGKYILYNFIIPSTHVLNFKEARIELITIFSPLLISLLLASSVILISLFNSLKKLLKKNIFISLRKFHQNKLNLSYIFYFTLVVFIISFIGRGKAGAIINSYLYFYFFSIVSICIYTFRIVSIKRLRDKTLILCLFLLIIIQMTTQFYNPFEEIKRKRMQVNHEEVLLKNTCDLSHPILYLNQSFFVKLYCGKSYNFNYAAAIDIIYLSSQFDIFDKQLKYQIDNKYYNYIVSDLIQNTQQIKDTLDSLKLIIQSEKNTKKQKRMVQHKRALEIEYYYRLKYKEVSRFDLDENMRIHIDSLEKLNGRKMTVFRSYN